MRSGITSMYYRFAKISRAGVSGLVLGLFVMFLLAFSVSANEDWSYDSSKRSLPGFAKLSDEVLPLYRAWVEQEENFLEQSEFGWIRTRVKLDRVLRKYGPWYVLSEKQYRSKMEEIDTVIRQAPSDLFTQVVLADVCSREFVEKCAELGVYDRIVELDPDNIYAHLIQIRAVELTFPTEGKQFEHESRMDSPEVRNQLIAASHANKYFNYSEMASIEWFEAHLDFVKKFPPPTAEQRSNPDYALAFARGGMPPLWPTGQAQIVSLCLYYLAEDEQELINACERLALKLQSHYQSSGFTIAYLYAERKDSFTPESLRLRRVDSVFERAQECLQPRWPKYKFLLPSTRQAMVEAYIQDKATKGTWIANQNAALLEYAENPSLYDTDPNECANYLDLDSESLRIVLGESDPYEQWFTDRENTKKAIEFESGVWSNLTNYELAYLVSKLGQVESVYDPLVKGIGKQGIRALPYLLTWLCADNSISSLAAAWAVAEIADTAILKPTLERMAEPQYERGGCRFTSALNMVLERTRKQHRRLVSDPPDPDYEMLIDKIVCAKDVGIDLDASDFDPSAGQIVIINTSPHIEGAFEKVCLGTAVQVVPFDPNRPRYKSQNLEIARLGVQIFDFDNDSGDMPAFEGKYGGAPQSIAVVKYLISTYGGIDLWIKVNGEWTILAKVAGLMI